jgi:hypothetical protein
VIITGLPKSTSNFVQKYLKSSKLCEKSLKFCCYPPNFAIFPPKIAKTALNFFAGSARGGSSL